MDRNLILAIGLSMGVLLMWDLLIVAPQRDAMEAERAAAAERAAEQGLVPTQSAPTTTGFEGILGDAPSVSIEEALVDGSTRVRIETAELTGSINLEGGRIDDLSLKNYYEELTKPKDESPIVRILTPMGAEHAHYAKQGWFIDNKPDQNITWTAPANATLTVETPVTLTHEADGLVFEKTFAVDDKYMFTVTQTVRNDSDAPHTAQAYGEVYQRGIPDNLKNFMILHEGPVGVIGKTLFERKYKTLRKNPNKAVTETGDGGWLGITNQYWLAAVAPPQDAPIEGFLRNTGTADNPEFRAAYFVPAVTVAPGETHTFTSNIFGGPKDVDVLQAYESEPKDGGLGLHDFDKAVDWGHLFVLTRPIFYTLDFFGDLTGNFGVAILILTLIVKALLFPIANKGYESMSKMKKLQPEVEKLRSRYADDKMKMQQEMMELYKKEKMNPLAGCVPILFQMPIFYALYKTLFVTIEMRHEPFVLWIKDLSAPDPTSIFNLFGLLPFDPTAAPVIGAFLGIGVLPILMGVAMWFQTKLNPPPADPMQAQIFAMLPFIFVFIFAPFAAGLVLYWFWNTALSIFQQWLIMKKNGVSVDWGERFKMPGRGGNKPAPGE